MTTIEQQWENYFKENFPDHPEVLELRLIPEDERDAFVLKHLNRALEDEGLAPIDRLLTPEQAQAEADAILNPQPQPWYRQYLRRLRRAWTILLGRDQ